MAENGNHPSEAGFTAAPPPVPLPPPADEPEPSAEPPAEVIAPTPVSLRVGGGAAPGRTRPVMAALTADTLWLQDTWELRRVPLSALAAIESLRNGKELVLTFRCEAPGETLRLTFAGGGTGRRWRKELEACRQQLPPEATPADSPASRGVALVNRAPDLPHVDLGRVAFTGADARTADRGLQLRAGLRGADAVIWVWRQKVSAGGSVVRHVSGIAIRVEDEAARRQLRQRWYAEEVGGLVNRSLLLLAVRAVLLFAVMVFCAGASPFHEATGQTPSQALAPAALGLGLVYAWPLALLALLRVLRWPGLLRTTGLGVLAATSGRGLTVVLAHLFALGSAGSAPTGTGFCLVVDPVDWALIIAGALLCRRAWRLAGDATHILPRPGEGGPPPARRAWAEALFALTALYAVGLLVFAGYSRYHASAALLRPGIDPRREQAALLAFNEGVAALDRDDLAAAERSFKASLQVWEELTQQPEVPPAYRASLGLTLYNLGWVSHRKDRPDEAEKYFERAVAVGDRLAGAPEPDAEFRRCLAEARRVLPELKAERLERLMREKDQQAIRKYEEANVKARRGAAEADGLYAEAIALWEGLLAQATVPDYRRFAATRLAGAYLELADLRQQLGKPREAGAALRKSVEYGEQAVALAPDRPLAKDNLEQARQMLDRQHEQELQGEIAKLLAAERFADAAEAWQQRIAEQEEALGSGQDREAAARRLAYRLDRFAWFLAHCPDGRVRDTKVAVKRARRATELRPEVGDYWYTLAMAQYRNGDWRDSLASLEQVKAREGSFVAADWLLVAMNRHQLKQRDQARSAFGKAAEWIDERKRQAEDNPLLRLQYEMMRPGLESLRREAEDLLEGKDPAQEGVGYLFRRGAPIG
jgi:tetratricopeptide (TPR) repeat protein